MQKIITFFLFTLYCTCLCAQHEDTNRFAIEFSNINYKNNNQSLSFVLDKLKYYTGCFSFYLKGKQEWIDSSYYLIDFEAENSTVIHLNIPSRLHFDDVRFNLGVDSMTNISGAFEGALDPINGMYWTWNSGYINAKIEGTIYKEEQEIEFKYHLGGYQAPFQSVHTLSFPVRADNFLKIDVDISYLLNDINKIKKPIVMSPGKNAKILSSEFSKCFKLNGNE